MEYKMGEDTCLNVIYDDRSPEDYDRLIKLFNEQGIVNYKFWDAVVLTHSIVESISESHKSIIRWAKENNLKECYIAEQDLFFTMPNGWEYFIDNKPESFDIYLGGNYLIDNPHEWKPPLIKLRRYVGNHCIVVSEKYYDTFLSVDSKQHIDTAQDDLGDFYCCYPFVALQRSGWSANAKAIVNYNTTIKKYLHETAIYNV